MNNIIEIANLSKSYSRFKLDNVSIEIPYNRIVGLIGENGAGKTTLISLILNQIKKDSGYIRIFGEDNIEKEKRIKQDIGFVVDECCFHSCLNARDIKKIMRSIYIHWDDFEFNSLLAKFNLDPLKKVSEMSKGMKTKLQLAVAMSHSPSLLILDEVTSGLDPVVRDDILLLLRDYVHKKRSAVLFSTHITSDLEKIADYIAFIHDGKLIFYESLEKLQNYNNFINPQKTNEKNVISIPTLDDIMLFYIKGDLMHDRIN